MAGGPLRFPYAPFVMAAACLLVVAALVPTIGCGKHDEPVTVVPAEAAESTPLEDAARLPGKAEVPGGDEPKVSYLGRSLLQGPPTPPTAQAQGFNGNMIGQLFQGGGGALGAFGGGFVCPPGGDASTAPACSRINRVESASRSR